VRWLAPVLVLVACRPGGINEVTGSWSAAPSSLTFPLTAVGRASTATVTLTNTGRNTVALTLSVPPPFSSPSTLQLGGGDAQTVTVTFAADKVGSATATLHIASDGATQDVSLTAEAVAAPCAEPTSCQTLLVAANGTCSVNSKPDGTACASSCLDTGTCQGGACFGTAKDCSDSDPCTLDSCIEGVGCVHSAMTCPSNDPCVVALCQAPNGCTATAAPDGTLCGKTDCTTSQVCISGQCVTRTTPEGGACGEATPCRDAGVCHAGQCLQAPPTMLVPEWTAVAPNFIRFTGVLDDQGNVFTIEGGAARELVKRAPNGTELFRVPISNPPVQFSFGHFILAQPYVVLASTSIEAYDAFDGHLAWSRFLEPELSLAYATDSCPPLTVNALFVTAVVSDGVGHLTASVSVDGSDPICHRPTSSTGFEPVNDTWAVGLDLATGSTRWKAGWNPSNFGSGLRAVVDEGGNVFMTATDGVTSDIRSWSPDGNLRWATQFQAFVQMWGAYRGSQLVSSSRVGVYRLDAATGASTVLVSRPGLYGYGAMITGVANVLDNGTLISADLQTGTTSTTAVFSSDGGTLQNISGYSLTSRGTLIFAAGDFGSSATMTLDELGLDGQLKYECPIPVPAAADPLFAAVSPGHVLIQSDSQTLMSFAVPGLALAAQGWVTPLGDASQECRPR
jgi:hypothetical protein